MHIRQTIRFLNVVVLLFAMSHADAKPVKSENSVSTNHTADNSSAILQANDAKGKVSGVVTDEAGVPLPGVVVRLAGVNRNTVTDVDGKFTIDVTGVQSPSLTFSYLGMEPKTVSVKVGQPVSVMLSAHSKVIDEVVVVGAYGTAQKRSDLVGSAYQVNADQLKALPQQRLDLMLDGLIPGLKIDPFSDAPDSSRPRYSLRVRGDASLSASNEPLWVLDGTPLYTGDEHNATPGTMYASVSPLSFLNPEDIESITVLKDATATSIYGADGANGVILVTTKKGREGKMRINVNAQYGIANIDRSTLGKVLNAGQYMLLAKEAYANAGLDMRTFPFQDNDMNTYSTTSTDWSDVYYGTGSTLQTNVSINGGAQKSDYYVSGQYYRNFGTVKGNEQQRMSIRSNMNFQLHRKVKFTVNLSASYNDNDIFNMGRDYYEFLPIYTPYYNDGTFRLVNKAVKSINPDGTPVYELQKFMNSVAEREQNINNQKAWFVNTNFMVRYDIMDGLAYTGQFGYDFQSNLEQVYSSRNNWSGMGSLTDHVGYSLRGTLNLSNWTTVHRLNYNKTFGKHTIGALLGVEASARNYTTVQATGSGFFNDKIQDVSYANERKGSNSSRELRKSSFIGQASYSFDHRYYLTVNGRRDGNSQFGSDVRWANFGSVGVSWNIHNESFFKVPWVNVLKLKASYGANGNSRLGSREALGLYSYGESYGYNGEVGGAQSGSPNRTLSWETTYMTNLGLRLAVLDNRIDLEVEYYHNKTKNLLSNLPVSRTTGDTRVYRNVGELLNKGFEVTLTTKNIVAKKQGGFEWTTDLNMAHNSNKITKLYNGIQVNFGTTSYMEGYDTSTYFLVRWAGVDPYDGMPMWYDKNGNLTKTYSSDDRVPYKNGHSVVTGGLTNTFAYKGLSLRFLLNYQLGGYAFTSFGRAISSDGLNIMDENQSVDQLNRWQKPGDIALNPKPIWGVSTQSVMNSTRFLYNKTLVRLQNLVLSYRIPTALVHGWGLSDCTVSLIGDNLLAYSPYSGKDRNSYKTTMSGYPLERSFAIALNVGF